MLFSEAAKPPKPSKTLSYSQPPENQFLTSNISLFNRLPLLHESTKKNIFFSLILSPEKNNNNTAAQYWLYRK